MFGSFGWAVLRFELWICWFGFGVYGMVCWYVGLMDLWPSWFCWLDAWLVGSSQAVHFCFRNIRCYGLGVCNVQGWRFFWMVRVCVLGCGLGFGVLCLGL